VSASINDRCPSFQWCPHYSNRQDDIAQLERENAELRKALQDAEVLASYTREDGKRQWVTLGEWLRPGQCIVLMDLADIDTYRTKEGAAP